MRGARTNWLPLICVFSCTFLLPIQSVEGDILRILPEIGAQDRTFGLYQDATKQYSTCLDALVEAAEMGETRGVIVWLNTWLDANVINSRGATALGKAAFNGHTDTVEELAARGADVNLRDSNGATALMMAADKGHTSVVKLLLAKGADANIQDKGGRTASSLAADRGHKEIVQLVEATGASVAGAGKETVPKVEDNVTDEIRRQGAQATAQDVTEKQESQLPCDIASMLPDAKPVPQQLQEDIWRNLKLFMKKEILPDMFFPELHGATQLKSAKTPFKVVGDELRIASGAIVEMKDGRRFFYMNERWYPIKKQSRTIDDCLQQMREHSKERVDTYKRPSPPGTFYSEVSGEVD